MSALYHWAEQGSPKGNQTVAARRKRSMRSFVLRPVVAAIFLFILFATAATKEKKKLLRERGDRAEVWRSEFVANRAGYWEFF